MPKTVADWEAKGWTSLALIAGETDEVPYDPATQNLVLKGQRFSGDGKMLKGRNRPHITADETDTGCEITSSDNVTVLYKIVGQEGDDDDDEVAAAG
jgi:hypothetical protein